MIFKNAQVNKAVFLFFSTAASLWQAASSGATAEPSLAQRTLIYFSYTCSDIHIISCCDILTPDAGWFIQVIPTNLHSYHARMGRTLRQWSGLWPKKANTQAKTRVGWIKKHSLSLSLSLLLSMDSLVCRSSYFTGAWTWCYAIYSWAADIPRSVQRSLEKRFNVGENSLMASKATKQRDGICMQLCGVTFAVHQIKWLF